MQVQPENEILKDKKIVIYVIFCNVNNNTVSAKVKHLGCASVISICDKITNPGSDLEDFAKWHINMWSISEMT